MKEDERREKAKKVYLEEWWYESKAVAGPTRIAKARLVSAAEFEYGDENLQPVDSIDNLALRRPSSTYSFPFLNLSGLCSTLCKHVETRYSRSDWY